MTDAHAYVRSVIGRTTAKELLMDVPRAMNGASRFSRTLVALSVATAVGLLGATGAQAAAWLTPVEVSSPQSSATPPGCGFLCFSSNPGAAGVDAAVDGQGNAVVAWTRRDDTNTQKVQAAFRPAGGSFSAPQTIGTTQSYVFGIFGPLADVAMDANGNAVLVWPTTKSGRTVVQYAFRPAGGAFGSPVDLTADDQTANGDPRVAMSASGEALAVWTRSNGTDTLVQASVKPAGASSFGPPTNLSAPGPAAASVEGNASSARVAMNDQGAAAVTWVRNNGSNQIAQARVRPAGQSFAAVQDLSATGQDASTPEVAMENGGRSTYIWSRPDGTRTRVQSRFMTTAGSPGAGVDDVSNDDRNGSSPQVALDQDNNAVAIWIGCPTAGGSCIVESAARSSNSSFGSVDPVSPPVDSQFLPEIEMDDAGNATAAWSDFTTARIRSARRPRGASFGAVDDLSPTPGSAFLPSLAADDQGNVIAGWPFTRPSDSKQVTQVAALDTAAPALANVAVPVSSSTGADVPMSASASDRWSGANISWDFGDGGTANGGSVSHTYGAPGTYTVTVRAQDGAGNASSATRTVQVTNPPPVQPPAPPAPSRPTRIIITMPFAFSKSTNKYTVFTLLQVKRIPRGSTLKVVCKAPKGKKCPAKSYTKRNARGTVSLKKWLKKRLAAGTKLTVTVTHTGNYIGAVKTMTVQKKKRPTFSDRCLRPGAKKPTRC